MSSRLKGVGGNWSNGGSLKTGIRAVLEIKREMEQWAPIGYTIPYGVPGSGIYPMREEY